MPGWAPKPAGWEKGDPRPTDDHYRLNPELLDVDYWLFVDAVNSQIGAASPDDRADALRRVFATYRGILAPSIAELWIEAARQHATRHAIDAADGLARHLADTDPDQAAAILEHAITAIDPLNEALHQLLIRLHQRRCRPGAARRTLDAITTALATIDTEPSAATRGLIHEWRQRFKV